MVCCTTGANTPKVLTSGIEPTKIPAEVMKVISAKHPDFIAKEATKKLNDGRIYFDVEGELPDGSEIEFDVLQTESGMEVVEIQRDLSWDALSEPVQQLAQKHSGGAKPARIIESIQTDGSTIFEFFAQDAPKHPAYEIQVRGDSVEVLKTRAMH